MAKGRNQHTFRKGQGGRTPGSKDAQSRVVKASVARLLAEVFAEDEELVKKAIRKGLKDDRFAHHYLKLAAEYLDGPPAQHHVLGSDDGKPLTVIFGGRYKPNE